MCHTEKYIILNLRTPAFVVNNDDSIVKIVTLNIFFIETYIDISIDFFSTKCRNGNVNITYTHPRPTIPP